MKSVRLNNRALFCWLDEFGDLVGDAEEEDVADTFAENDPEGEDAPVEMECAGNGR